MIEMLRCHIVLISWSLATTIATTPTDNIKQSTDNDRNFPRYSYVYSIENDDGGQQRKTETKSGELSNGQYYIKNNQSSTDVKLFVDKWGYHPIVKYSTSNERNAKSSAHLVFDNHPLYELINTTDNGNGIISPTNVEGNISSVYDSWASLQSPIRSNVNIYNQSTSGINLMSNVDNIGLTNDTLFTQQEPKNDVVKYNPVMELLNSNDSIDSLHQDAIQTMYFSNDNLNSAEIENARTIIIENILLRKRGEIANTNENDPALRQQTSSYNYRTALANFRKYLKLDDRIADMQLDNTPELQIPEADRVNSQIELPAILNNTEIKSRNLRNESITIDTNSKKTFLDKITLLKSNENVKFTRPIVVAEISNMDQLNDSTIFSGSEVHAKLIPSTAIGIDTSSLVTDKTPISQVTPTLLGAQIFEGESQITVSSNIRNPIQAGLDLVDSGKALTPIVNTMKFTENSPIDSNQLLNNNVRDEISQYSNMPPIINSTINKFDNTIKSSAHTSSSINDQTIEILKSLELYHSSPIQEIHYPAQLTPIITSIDQQQRRTNKQLRNVELYKEDIDFINHNGKILKYETTVNQPVSKLLEPKKRSDSNNPPSIYVMNDRQKIYGNNDEHLAHPLENHINRSDQLRFFTSQSNSGNTENKYIDTRLRTKLYLPYKSKNSYSIIEQRELSNFHNDKLVKQDMAIIATKVPPRTQSIPQNLFSENTELSDAVHHLEIHKLNNRDQHINQQRLPNGREVIITSKASDYSKTNIDSAQQQIQKVNSISKQYTDDTSIIDNSISSGQTQTKISNNVLISDMDNDINNTVYIHIPNINGRINNIRDYGHSLNNPPEKFFYYPVHRETAIRPSSHPGFTNGIDARTGLYATQPYPVQSVGKIIDETKNVVPYPLHKLVAQPYPVHILQPYGVEKSTNIPNESAYSVNIPVKISYPLEFTENAEKMIQLPYSMPIGLNYRNIMNQHILKFKDKDEVVNPLNLSFSANMSDQGIHGHIQVKPLIPFMSLLPVLSKRYSSSDQFANTKQYYRRQQSLNFPSLTEESYSSQSPFQSYTTTNVNHLLPLRWHVIHRNDEKIMNKNMEYLNAVPFVPHALNASQLNQMMHSAHQQLFRYSTNVPVPAKSSLKDTKLSATQYHSNTGHFRQSKMEYGFKPPMIPSIQYDERMAMKVEY